MPNESLTLGAPSARLHVAPRGTLAAAWRLLRREPLVHFCLLGGLIFAADAILHPPSRDERVITVTKAMRQSFIEGYDEDKERVPSETELKLMIDSWVASEILYREGKALGVDRGDESVRERIAFKLQLLIFNQIAVPRPTEAELRTWVAENRARFDEPERVGFYVGPPTDEAAARGQLDNIKSGRETADLQKRVRALLARPVSSLAPAFGESFRDELLALPFEQWTVLRSKEGWHLVRLDSRRSGIQAKFDDVRDEAERLWNTEETRKRAWDAVNRLKANYTVRYEP